MNYFTSDWHLGEDRIGINGKPDLFFRPFDSVYQNDFHIKQGFVLSKFNDGDTLWHLGDAIYNAGERQIHDLKTAREFFPNSDFHLIIGNYDEDKLEILERIFDTVQHEAEVELAGRKFYLNHYPTKCIDKEFSITGHIHGAWRVQKNMINVGVDAWHFKPVSEEQILFARTACEKHYDKNVFPY